MSDFSKDKLTPPEDSGLPIREEVERRMKWVMEMAKTEPILRGQGSEKLNRWVAMLRRMATRTLAELKQEIEEERAANMTDEKSEQQLYEFLSALGLKNND